MPHQHVDQFFYSPKPPASRTSPCFSRNWARTSNSENFQKRFSAWEFLAQAYEKLMVAASMGLVSVPCVCHGCAMHSEPKYASFLKLTIGLVP